MKKCFIFLFMAVTLVAASGQNYVIATAKQGDGVYALVRRYFLHPIGDYVDKFIEINDLDAAQPHLAHGRQYKMPIYRFTYDGNTIRTTFGYSDYSHARKIQNYNESVYRAGLKSKPYTQDLDLWVPIFNLPGKVYLDTAPEAASDPEPPSSGSLHTFPIFGKQYEKTPMQSNKLNNRVYYLVSGHGGPDPGAVGKRGRHRLYEDEYAYDITLRLARRLLEMGAKVYLIVRDPNDGIRDESILAGDRDEFYFGGSRISAKPIKRLQGRVKIINKYYYRNRRQTKEQYVVILHVDSQSRSRRIDVFYYYKKGDLKSRNLALYLYRTIKRKYDENQPGRGYRGMITYRDLYMLRHCKPTTVYIELGNIRNTRDQDRFIQTNNRQALANWLCEGLINAANSN